MSADNWRACPKCFAEKFSKLNWDYENPDAYYEQLEKIEMFVENEHKMREDYSIGLDAKDGILKIRYRCACYTCNYTATYEHEVQLFPEKQVTEVPLKKHRKGVK